jgi:acyl-coenzyme A thioesterase 13
MKVVKILLNKKAEEEKKLEARLVVELDVMEGQYIYSIQMPNSLLFIVFVLNMLNGAGNIHGGCSAFLVDA